jgi:Fungal fucose-specific lectin
MRSTGKRPGRRFARCVAFRATGLLCCAAGLAGSPAAQRELSRRRRALAAHRVMLAVLPALVLLLGAASSAHANGSFYWYGQNNSACWPQTGEIAAEAPQQCDGMNGIEGWFLNTAEPVRTLEGALNGDLGLTQSGDYCNAYNLNEGPFYTRDPSNESGLTGFNPAEDTMTDGHGSVCQALGGTWGQGLRPAGKATCGPCGMHHYVSFASQNRGLRPWSNAFAGPALVIEAAAYPHTASASFAWGYLCPLFEQVNSPNGDMFEYCFVEWTKGWGLPPAEGQLVGSLSVHEHNALELRTDFALGTSFSTEIAGSGNSVYGEHTEPYPFKAAITEANLLAAIRAANSPPPRGYGYSLSENLSEYALIGVEQGTEENNSTAELGEKTEGLKLYTEYSALNPPTVTTEAATGVQQTEAILHGTVNPHGIATKYHFEYGKTTSYGSRTEPEGDAGAGSSPVPEIATITKLATGTVYHYRLVGTSGGVTSYGADQQFTTQEEPSSSRWMAYNRSTGRIMVFYQGSNNEIDAWNYEIGTNWTWGEHNENHPAAAGTTPTIAYNPETGRVMVFYQGSNHEIDVWNYEIGTNWTWGEHNENHPAAAGTSPTVAYDRNTGRIMVFYQGSNHEIDVWNYEVGVGWKWGEHNENHPAAAGTSPTVAYDRNTGRIMVFYQGSNHEIDAWNYEISGGWKWGEHNENHPAAAGTSPTMSYNPETGRVMVFYQGSNHEIDAWNYETSGGWKWGEHNENHPAAAGTSPTMSYNPETGRVMVFYQGSNNEIDAWNYEIRTNWTWGEHNENHPAAAGTSPTMSYNPETGRIIVFYQGSNNEIDAWNYENGSWTWGEHGGHPA